MTFTKKLETQLKERAKVAADLNLQDISRAGVLLYTGYLSAKVNTSGGYSYTVMELIKLINKSVYTSMLQKHEAKTIEAFISKI